MPLLDDRAMRIGYIWSRPIPSRDTDTQQVMKTVDALVAEGAQVDLILPESRHMRLAGMSAFEAELRAFYSLRSPLSLRAVRGVEPSRIELERLVHALLSCLAFGSRSYDVLYTRSRSAAMLCALRGGPVVFETYRRLGKEHPLLVRVYAKLAAQPNLLGIVTHSNIARESIEAVGFPGAQAGDDPQRLRSRRHAAALVARSGARRARSRPGAGDRVLHRRRSRAQRHRRRARDGCVRRPRCRYLIAGGRAGDVADLEAEIARRRLPNVRCLGWRPVAELRRSCTPPTSC